MISAALRPPQLAPRLRSSRLPFSHRAPLRVEAAHPVPAPGGPRVRPARLELFKFALYVFFPIATMLHFGDPDWYDKHVGPIRAHFVQAEKPQIEPPHTPSELKLELDRLRAERLAKKASREAAAAAAAAPSPPHLV